MVRGSSMKLPFGDVRFLEQPSQHDLAMGARLSTKL